MRLPTWFKRLIWKKDYGKSKRSARRRRADYVDLHIAQFEERRVLNATVIVDTLSNDPNASGGNAIDGDTTSITALNTDKGRSNCQLLAMTFSLGAGELVLIG